MIKVRGSQWNQMTIYIVSVLGQEEGYTVQYTPSPEGDSKGKARGKFWRWRGIFNRKSRVESQYGHCIILIIIRQMFTSLFSLTVYSLASVLCNIPLAPRKYWRVWFQYSIVKNNIMTCIAHFPGKWFMPHSSRLEYQ